MKLAAMLRYISILTVILLSVLLPAKVKAAVASQAKCYKYWAEFQTSETVTLYKFGYEREDNENKIYWFLNWDDVETDYGDYSLTNNGVLSERETHTTTTDRARESHREMPGYEVASTDILTGSYNYYSYLYPEGTSGGYSIGPDSTNSNYSEQIGFADSRYSVYMSDAFYDNYRSSSLMWTAA